MNNGTRIPESVSRYILEYYVRHATILLDNTNLRTTEANRERTLAIQKLVAEIKFEFGYEVSEKKIKNHFEHVRAKVLQKGYAINYAASKGKRYFPRGLANSSASCLPRKKEPFKNAVEEVIWKYYEGRPVCINERGIIFHSQKGVSYHTGERRNNSLDEQEHGISHAQSDRMECKREAGEQTFSESPSMDDIVIFDSNECIDRHSEGVQTTPDLSVNTCQASSDLLQEMRLFCQEQRQFVREMTNTMREVCSLVQLTRSQLLEQAVSKSRSVRLKEILQNDNVRVAKEPLLP